MRHIFYCCLMVKASATATAPQSTTAPSSTIHLLSRCPPQQTFLQSSWAPCLGFTSRSQFFIRVIINSSQVSIHISARFGPIQPSSPLRTSSQMPILSVWLADGRIKPDNAIAKASNYARLKVLCTSNSADIEPCFAYHATPSARSAHGDAGWSLPLLETCVQQVAQGCI